MAPLKGELAAAQPLTEGLFLELLRGQTPPALRATSPFRGGNDWMLAPCHFPLHRGGFGCGAKSEKNALFDTIKA